MKIALLLVVALTWLSPATPQVAAGVWHEHGDSRWRFVRSVATGSMPWGVSVSPDGSSVYVTHVGYRDHDNVWRYDAATLERRAASRFRGHAVESIPSRDGRSLYVTNSREDELVVLDADSLAVRTRHRTGRVPKDFRLTEDEKQAWIAEYGAGTLGVLDLESGELAQVPVGRLPRGVAVARDGSRAWSANMGAGTVSIVDAKARKIEKTLPVCRSVRHLVVRDLAPEVLVTCHGGRELVVIDAARGEIVKRLRVGRGPKTVVLTRDERFAITADERGDTITLVDTTSWQTLTLPVPARQPIGVAVSPDDRTIYVTARGSGELLVFERQRLASAPTR